MGCREWDLLLELPEAEEEKGRKGAAAAVGIPLLWVLCVCLEQDGCRDFVPQGSRATAEVVPLGYSLCPRHSTGSSTSVINYLSYLMIPDPQHPIIHPKPQGPAPIP